MKKIISASLFGLLFCLAGFLLYSIHRAAALKKLASAHALRLPPFSFKRLNGTAFTRDSLYGFDGHLIIEYFNPDCEHCQYMAKAYSLHKPGLSHCKLLMVTFADSASTARFFEEYHLSNDPNILCLTDPEIHFGSYFGVSVIPSFLVYRNNKLLNRFIGETKFDNLTTEISINSYSKNQ